MIPKYKRVSTKGSSALHIKMLLFLSLAVTVAAIVFVCVCSYVFHRHNGKNRAPGPTQYPFIGSIPYLAKFSTFSEAMAAIGKEFGPVASLKLGVHDALVISGPELIRFILNSAKFDSRANFARFRILFEGDRNNGLAFADGSENLRIKRRFVLRHAFPKKGSAAFGSLDSIVRLKIGKLFQDLKLETVTSTRALLKRRVQSTCLQIFFQFFCSLDVDPESEDFAAMLDAIDAIFTEMNAECVGDVLPFLMPFCGKDGLHSLAIPIRNFMMKYYVEPRMKRAVDGEPTETPTRARVKDMADEFMSSIGKVEGLTLLGTLYSIEDLLGGSAALASMMHQGWLMLASNPHVQAKIREEVRTVVGNSDDELQTTISLEHHKFPYVEAVLLEIARTIGSPLVPHVANEDTTIESYAVKKGTILCFNNGELNNSEKYWTAPETFDPDRFLDIDHDGAVRVRKPDFFFPYGLGRRSCLGTQLVYSVGVLLIANMCRTFELWMIDGEDYRLTKGSLAVPGRKEGYALALSMVPASHSHGQGTRGLESVRMGYVTATAQKSSIQTSGRRTVDHELINTRRVVDTSCVKW